MGLRGQDMKTTFSLVLRLIRKLSEYDQKMWESQIRRKCRQYQTDYLKTKTYSYIFFVLFLVIQNETVY